MNQTKVFYGYCHTGNSWTPKVRLSGTLEACKYIMLHRRLWQEVRVTDQSDHLVAQAVNGKIIYPMLEL